MAIVKAKRNPNSQASLYGNTRSEAWTDTLDDFFIQKADGTYTDRQGNPVDFNALVEPAYWNADGMQGGGRIYDDPSTFTRAEAPVWYDEYLKNNPLFGGREFADVDEFFTNPAMQSLNSSVQEPWLDKYRPDRGSWTGDLNPVTMLMLAALGGGGLASYFGGAGAAGGGYAAADALGLSQMGQAAGLSGSSLADFIASGGTLGSTAAGGGGIGLGALADGAQFADLGGTATDAITEGALPNIDPNAVMGVDYGTMGEGTGLLQGAATGAGGPTLAQILGLASATGSPLSYLSQVLSGGGDTPVVPGSLSGGGSSLLRSLLQSQQGGSSGLDSLLGMGISGLGAAGAYKYADSLPQVDIGGYDDLLNDSGDMSGILGNYDQQTGFGRSALNSSLGARGVLGSSFGDMALTNYDTQRGIGRGTLGYQGLGVKGNLLDSKNRYQLAQNAIKTDLVGRGLSGIAGAAKPASFDLMKLLGLT